MTNDPLPDVVVYPVLLVAAWVGMHWDSIPWQSIALDALLVLTVATIVGLPVLLWVLIVRLLRK